MSPGFLDRFRNRLGRAKPRGRGNYAYVTARIRARKAKLLPRDAYPKLLARDAHEIARTLQEGEYKDEVDALAGRKRGAELIEHATRRNLARTYQDVLGWCEGELAAMVELYLGRYDVYNVKTVLRGVFAGVDPEEIEENLVPAGRLSLEELQEMARLPTLDDVLEAVRQHGYGAAVDEVQEEDEVVQDLRVIENAVDQVYYGLLVDSVEPKDKPRRAFLNFLQREIDVVNLKTLLRLRAEDIQDVQEFFVEGGDEVTLETMTHAAQAPMEDLPQELSGLGFFDDIASALEAYVETRNLNEVVTALDQFLIQSSEGFTIRYPLSVLPVIDFILRKRIEVDNLRAIAHGKETGLDNDIIEELLIL